MRILEGNRNLEGLGHNSIQNQDWDLIRIHTGNQDWKGNQRWKGFSKDSKRNQSQGTFSKDSSSKTRLGKI